MCVWGGVSSHKVLGVVMGLILLQVRGLRVRGVTG